MAQISGQASVGFDGNTSQVVSTQGGPLGRHAFDNDGNEYIYLDFGEAFAAGEWVTYNNAFLAAQLTSTSRGFVACVMGTVSASDRYGWAMIRGVHTGALATSGSSAGGPVVAAATTDLGSISTDVTTGNVAIHIHGLYLSGSPDTCASTALSSSAPHGIATVYLNYPFITGSVVPTDVTS